MSDSYNENSNNSLDRDTVISAAIQAIPYVGSSISTLYFGHKQERRFRRIESFYDEIKNEVKGMQGKIADLNSHDPDEFRAILEELHEQIESEQIAAKRKFYKTYFKSTLVNPVRGNFEERKLFLNILQDLSPLQIELLAFLIKRDEPTLANQINKPGVDQALITGSIGQLRNHGLITTQLNSLAFGGGGGQMNESVSVSEFGQRFHNFCVKGEY